MSSPSMPSSSARQRCALWGARGCALVLASLLAACASTVSKAPDAPVPSPKPQVVKVRPAFPGTSPQAAFRPGPAPTREIDGPGLTPASDPASVPDAEPTLEAIRLGGPNKPYEALGRSYVPLTEDKAYTERGLASWYGRKFQGRRTASGERYDMYSMTAAHPTLPLPSFVRVRNPANGNEVVVRINDRGPFHPGRIIDLSYTAALKLGVAHGVAPVEVERITQDEIRAGTWRRDKTPPDPTDAAVDRQLAQRRGTMPTVMAIAAPAAPAVAIAALGPLPARVPRAVLTSPVPASSPVQVAATGTDVVVAKGLTATQDDVARTVVPITYVTSSPAQATTTVAAVAMAAPVVTPALTPLPAVSAGPAVARTAGLAGYWVQLGAFRLRDGAESFQRRVAADLGWIAPLLSVLTEADLHRLQAGPYPNRDEAASAAQRVREALSLVPVIVERQ